MKSEAVRKHIATTHREAIEEIKQAIKVEDVVIVGVQMNPFVTRAAIALHDSGFPHKIINFGSLVSSLDVQLAIKMWTGWPSFPQIFVKGVLIGGYDDLVVEITHGIIRQRLTQSRGLVTQF